MQRIRFSRPEMLFSLKSFAGAMLALYLACRAGLPRPFWAFMTAYIVAHPLAGNVRSKALYRFVGTLLGCAATVVLIPALSAARELLTLALALWTGLCLYLSLLDRSARSYVFLLAGYSAALIGFPLVEAPAAMFDTAVARVQEIGLGILCASLVHSLVLPASFSALRKFADDLADPTGDLIVAHLLLAERVRGAGLANALEDLAQSIAEEVGVRRKIEADRAKPRQAIRITTIATVILIGLMPFVSQFMAPYKTPLGQLLLAVWIALDVVMLLWLKKITAGKPTPRILANLSDTKGAL